MIKMQRFYQRHREHSLLRPEKYILDKVKI